MTFTDEERIFLKEMKQTKIWSEILEKISHPVPRYHPDNNKNWEYESGRSLQAEVIRKTLGG